MINVKNFFDDFAPKARNEDAASASPDFFSQLAPMSQGGAAIPGEEMQSEQQLIADSIPKPEEPDDSLILSSIKRGTGNTFASLAGLMESRDAQKRLEEYSQQFPREVETFRDIKTMGNLYDYALESGFENLTNVGIMATGALLGTAGTILSGGTLPAGGMALLGMGTANLALQAGETKGTVEAAGEEATVGNVLPVASLNAAIDTFSFLRVAKNAGVLYSTAKHLDEAAEVSGLAAKAAQRAVKGVKAGAESFVTEGLTEAVQTYNNEVAARLAGDKSFKEALTVQGLDPDEMIESFLRGGLGAAITSGPLAATKPTESLSGKSLEGDTTAAPVVEERKGEGKTSTLTPDTPEPTPKDTPMSPSTDPISSTGSPEQLSDSEVEALPQTMQERATTLSAQLDETIASLEAQGEGQPETLKNAVIREYFSGLAPADTATTRFDRATTEAEAANADRALGILKGSFYTDEAIGEVLPQDGKISGTFSELTKLRPGTIVTDMTDSKGNTVFNPVTTKTIADTVESWRKDFFPDSTVAVGTRNAFHAGPSEAMASHAFMGGTQSQVSGILLNPEAIYKNVSRQGTPTEAQVQRQVLEALSHEMGHAIVAQRFRQEMPSVKAALYRQYKEWIESVKTETFDQWASKRYTSSNLQTMYANNKVTAATKDMPALEVLDKAYSSIKARQYFMSFDEFAAENISSVLTGKTSLARLPAESRNFWKRAIEVLKQLFKKAQGKMEPGSFKDWVRKMQAESDIRDLRDRFPYRGDKAPGVDKEMGDLVKGETKDTKLSPKSNPATRMESLLTNLGIPEAFINSVRSHARLQKGFTRSLGGKLLSPLQIQERVRTPSVDNYIDQVQKYSATKMKTIIGADEAAQDWMGLGKTKANNLSKFIFAASEKSDTESRRLTPEELQELRKEYSIDDQAYAVYTKIDTVFQETLGRLQSALESDAAKTYATNWEAFLSEYRAAETIEQKGAIVEKYAPESSLELMSQMTAIQKQMESLYNRNYFPRMRFGSYTITIRKANEEGEFKTDEFMTFESRKERDLEYNRLTKELSADNYTIEASKLDDSARSLIGMPSLVINKIEDALGETEGGMSAEQRAVLNDIALHLSPGKRFLRNLQKRKGVKGFSDDAMRVFAAYTSNASNHMARIEHGRDMTEALRVIERESTEAKEGDLTSKAELASYFRDHFKYLMNPENDWAKWRALGFYWYLGFNPSSAIMNFSQLPMVTYPYLAARHGDVATSKAMAKAMTDYRLHFTDGKSLSPERQRLLDRLTEEGLIDESISSEIAGIGEGTTLSRIAPDAGIDRMVNKFSYYAGYMFRIAEKYNRRATALAAFDLSYKDSNFEAAYRDAKTAIQASQFEYSKWNRPEYMRGKKSIVFLFQSYMQNFLYLAFAGGKSRAARGTAFRVWGMLLLLAGVQGLPGADLLFSSIDFLGNKMKSFLGLNNPRVNIREEIRSLIGELTDSPDLVMHGLGRQYGLGPAHLLELSGAPIPHVDVSGRIGMGSPLPFIGQVSPTASPSEALAQQVVNGLGPVAGIGVSVYKAVTSNDPDTWKRTEQALPVAVKNASKAVRYATRGEETTRGDVQFLAFDGGTPEHWAEITTQALGYTPTRMAQKREIYGEQMQAALFWRARKSVLFEAYGYARMSEDREGIADATKAIKQHNDSLTAPELQAFKISRRDLKRNLENRYRIAAKKERGLAPRESEELLYRHIRMQYEE